jgi:hypothetical protein
MVLKAQIGGYNVGRVFMDAGSSINLIYARTLKAMCISLENLKPTDCSFHGIVPGAANYPLGKIELDVCFGNSSNYRREKLEFEFMDWPSQYHAILGHPAFAKFMVVPHYTYLTLKILRPKGTITIQGSFEVSNTCNKEFNRLAQTFGMTAEYARLKGETDHNVLPNVGRSLPDQAFDVTQDSKKIQVHPTDPNKTTSIASEQHRLENAGFIQEIKTSTWVSNPVIVPKKNIDVQRVCVDYTSLNKHCPKDPSLYLALIK